MRQDNLVGKFHIFIQRNQRCVRQFSELSADLVATQRKKALGSDGVCHHHILRI